MPGIGYPSFALHPWGGLASKECPLLLSSPVAHQDDIGPLLETVSRVPDILDYEHLVVASVVKDVSGALITEGLSSSLICYQCKDPIHGNPIKVRMDMKGHSFCCHSCEKLHVERYRRIKEMAQASRSWLLDASI